MFGTHDIPLFIASGLLLNITPGADTLYIVTHSATRGARAGLAAAFGVSPGCCFHILAATLGLSALLAASASAFIAVKLVGAAYLVYVGISMCRPYTATAESAAKNVAPDSAAIAPTPAEIAWRRVLVRGFLTNALNPKVALFFLAFMPQFIAPDAPHKALAFLFLGTVFNINGTLWNLFLVWSAVRVRALGIGHGAARWLSRGVGALFILLGLRLAFARPD